MCWFISELPNIPPAPRPLFRRWSAGGWTRRRTTCRSSSRGGTTRPSPRRGFAPRWWSDPGSRQTPLSASVGVELSGRCPRPRLSLWSGRSSCDIRCITVGQQKISTGNGWEATLDSDKWWSRMSKQTYNWNSSSHFGLSSCGTVFVLLLVLPTYKVKHKLMVMVTVTIVDLNCDIRITGARLVLGNKPLCAHHCKTRSELSTFWSESCGAWSQDFLGKEKHFWFVFLRCSDIFVAHIFDLIPLMVLPRDCINRERDEISKKDHNKETGRQRQENIKFTNRQVK